MICKVAGWLCFNMDGIMFEAGFEFSSPVLANNSMAERLDRR